MSGLQKTIEKEMVAAMKAKEKEKVSTLRMVKAAIQNKAIEKREDLGDEDVRRLSRYRQRLCRAFVMWGSGAW